MSWGFRQSSQDCVCELQMDEEVVLAKLEAVKRYRSMFIFATQPQHPPSASDIAIELMCTYAKFGMRD